MMKLLFLIKVQKIITFLTRPKRFLKILFFIKFILFYIIRNLILSFFSNLFFSRKKIFKLIGDWPIPQSPFHNKIFSMFELIVLKFLNN